MPANLMGGAGFKLSTAAQSRALPTPRNQLLLKPARLARSSGRSSKLSPQAVAAGAQHRAPSAYLTGTGFIDYYEVLGVDDDAPAATIKSAYRSLAKACHPDFLGQKGHEMCIILNEAYETLSDAMKRHNYDALLEQALQDEDDDFTGQPLSKWCADHQHLSKATNNNEQRAVFVDEVSCIGCRQCVWCAPATFRMEESYGRSRVFAQWVDTEDNLSAAVDACPVNCIHWVQKQELAALEYVMQTKMKRVDVGIMMAGQGGGLDDPFTATERYLKLRAEKQAGRERNARYSQQHGTARQRAAEDIARRQAEAAGSRSGGGGSFWDAVGSAFGVAGLSNMMASYVEEDGGDRKVGKRKRVRRGADAAREALPGMGGATIPLERALVPVRISNT